LLALDQLAQSFDREPLLRAVDHPVAVGADQREVDNARLDLAGHAEGRAVVTLDVVQATLAVGPVEVEPAGFTSDGDPALPGVSQLVCFEVRIAFPESYSLPSCSR
jgi:hypothetical protein